MTSHCCRRPEELQICQDKYLISGLCVGFACNTVSAEPCSRFRARGAMFATSCSRSSRAACLFFTVRLLMHCLVPSVLLRVHGSVCTASCTRLRGCGSVLTEHSMSCQRTNLQHVCTLSTAAPVCFLAPCTRIRVQEFVLTKLCSRNLAHGCVDEGRRTSTAALHFIVRGCS